MGKSLLPLPFKTHLARLTEKYWDASEDEITRFTAGNVVFTEWETRSLSK